MVYKRAEKALSLISMSRFIAISVIASISIHILIFVLVDKYAPKEIKVADAPTIVSIVEEPHLPSPPPPSAPPPSSLSTAKHYERLVPPLPIPPPTGQGSRMPEAVLPPPVRPSGPASPALDFSDVPMTVPGRIDRDGVKLLDPQVVDEYARRTEQELAVGNRLSISTDEFKYKGYMRNLKARVESIWRYPKEAIERGISGDLYIEFVIKRNGALGPVRLARTSGYPVLDQAAMKALRDSAPFMPMPTDWEDKGMIVMGQFIYSGRGLRYVR